MPLKAAATPPQPVLVLNPYTNRHLDVQPLLAYLDANDAICKPGDPLNVAGMLQDVQDFVSMHTRAPDSFNAESVLEGLNNTIYTLVELRKVFAAMREVG